MKMAILIPEKLVIGKSGVNVQSLVEWVLKHKLVVVYRVTVLFNWKQREIVDGKIQHVLLNQALSVSGASGAYVQARVALDQGLELDLVKAVTVLLHYMSLKIVDGKIQHVLLNQEPSVSGLSGVYVQKLVVVVQDLELAPV